MIKRTKHFVGIDKDIVVDVITDESNGMRASIAKLLPNNYIVWDLNGKIVLTQQDGIKNCLCKNLTIDYEYRISIDFNDLLLIDEYIGEYGLLWRKYVSSDNSIEIYPIPVLPGIFEDDNE